MLLLSVFLFASTGCGGGDDERGAGDDAPGCDFAGTTEAARVEPVGGPFSISEVRHEVDRPGCEERLLFLFESLPDGAEPGYQVSYREPPFSGPAGMIEVDGEMLLEIVLLEASGGGEPDRGTEAALIVDIVKPPEVPGGSLWLVGLGEEHPFTVSIERTPEPALIVAIGAPGES